MKIVYNSIILYELLRIGKILFSKKRSEKMNFETYGGKDNKAIILIHGAFVSWKMWSEYIETFKKDYFVIVPILDGHDVENKSIFTTIQKSASDIADYVCKTYGKNVLAVIGISLGGVIATEILVQKKLNIEKAIIDGAYLTTMSPWLCKIFAKIMVKLSHGIKSRNKTFKYIINQKFSPKTIEEIYRICPNMSDETIENIAFSNYSYTIPDSIANGITDIAYWYGEKEKRLLSKSAKQLSKLVLSSQIEEFEGLGHGGLVSKHSDIYIKKIHIFFSNT